MLDTSNVAGRTGRRFRPGSFFSVADIHAASQFLRRGIRVSGLVTIIGTIDTDYLSIQGSCATAIHGDYLSMLKQAYRWGVYIVTRLDSRILPGDFLLNVGLTRTRVPTATPEDDRGEKAEPRRYALLTLIRCCCCC